MVNRLADATSPYLRHHADNPIDWWPWGKEAFIEAQQRDLPILISIGYDSCHWCHVMAEESFTDASCADFINTHFIAIKVDKAEHPDIDQIYMNATQALTGRGGWPNTVFCTPTGQPFFAGGYFPPIAKDGMPSFSEVVKAIAEAWEQRRGEVLDSASTIVSELAQQRTAMPGHAIRPDLLDPQRMVAMLLTSFDSIHGGFSHAPKFPHAPVLDALLTLSDQSLNDKALYTLDAMSRGGIYDQIGGGFHRYSVDAGWEVPHFEKMLDDNALLIGTYTRAWLRSIPDDGTEQRERFAHVVSSTISWLDEQMRLPSQAFAASLDADSPDDKGTMREGAYYLWHSDDFNRYLGGDSRFAHGVFHLTHEGNMPSGSERPTDGSRLGTLQFHGNPHPGRIANVIATLKAIRDQRPMPSRDETVIAAWNGLVIDSLTFAAMVFGRPQWLKMARQAAEAVWNVHWDAKERILYRTSVDGIRGSSGMLSDYAALGLGYMRLGAALGESEWCERAVMLIDRACELFIHADGSYLDSHSDLAFAPAQRFDDEAAPSGNAIFALALRLISLYRHDESYREKAVMIDRRLSKVLVYSPRFSGWALAQAIIDSQEREGYGSVSISIHNASSAINDMSQACWRLAPWASLVMWKREEDSSEYNSLPRAEICRRGSCLPAIDDFTQIARALWPSVSLNS